MNGDQLSTFDFLLVFALAIAMSVALGRTLRGLRRRHYTKTATRLFQEGVARDMARALDDATPLPGRGARGRLPAGDTRPGWRPVRALRPRELRHQYGAPTSLNDDLRSRLRP